MTHKGFSSVNSSNNAVYADNRTFPQRMLPDADDFPALATELAVDSSVAGHVVIALFVPEGTVGFRAGVAFGASVPETSIDEDGDLLLGKCKVGLSRQRKMPSPADDLVLPQQR